jgi:hypothetical protein
MERPAQYDPFVLSGLKRLEKLAVLVENEILVETERASHGGSVGALIVTDRRILYVHRRLIRRRVRILQLRLASVSQVEALPYRDWFGSGYGAINLSYSTANAEGVLSYTHIPGGEERAREIARSIMWQRAHPPNDAVPGEGQLPAAGSTTRRP